MSFERTASLSLLARFRLMKSAHFSEMGGFHLIPAQFQALLRKMAHFLYFSRSPSVGLYQEALLGN